MKSSGYTCCGGCARCGGYTRGGGWWVYSSQWEILTSVCVCVCVCACVGRCAHLGLVITANSKVRDLIKVSGQRKGRNFRGVIRRGPRIGISNKSNHD